MTDQTLADLYREAGLSPAWRNTPEANSPPRRPMPRQMRARLPTYADAQREPPRGEAYAPPTNQIAGAGQQALEMTGLPSVRRSARAFINGDPRTGAEEGALGLLGVAGVAGLVPRGGRVPPLERYSFAGPGGHRYRTSISLGDDANVTFDRIGNRNGPYSSSHDSTPFQARAVLRNVERAVRSDIAQHGRNSYEIFSGVPEKMAAYRSVAARARAPDGYFIDTADPEALTIRRFPDFGKPDQGRVGLLGQTSAPPESGLVPRGRAPARPMAAAEAPAIAPRPEPRLPGRASGPEASQGGVVRRTIDAPHAPGYGTGTFEILQNPTVAQIERFVAREMRDPNNSWVRQTRAGDDPKLYYPLRYLQDAEGNIYISSGLNVEHSHMAEGLRARGVDLGNSAFRSQFGSGQLQFRDGQWQFERGSVSSGGDFATSEQVFEPLNPNYPSRRSPPEVSPGGIPRPPPRLPGRASDGSVLPVRPREPFRNSLRGGSEDLAGAARMEASPKPIEQRSNGDAYSRALVRRPNATTARALLLDAADANPVEHAAYASREGITEPVSGTRGHVNLGQPPPNGGDLHHTHDTTLVAPAPASLSHEDMIAFVNQDRVPAMFAHETGGGGSVITRGPRMRARTTAEAMHKGQRAATDRILNKELGGDELEGRGSAYMFSTVPTARAAARHGIFSEFGYRPSTADQEAFLEATRRTFRQAEGDAFRKMHGEIYGLPYPFSVSRIGAAAALAGAVEAERRHQRGKSSRTRRKPPLGGFLLPRRT